MPLKTCLIPEEKCENSLKEDVMNGRAATLCDVVFLVQVRIFDMCG